MGKKSKKSKGTIDLQALVERHLTKEGIVPAADVLDLVRQKSRNHFLMGDADLLNRAYYLADEHNWGYFRKETNPATGTPYPFMQHLTSVAFILAYYGYNLSTVISGIFHDSEDRPGNIKKIGLLLRDEFPHVVSNVAYICADDHNNRNKSKTEQKEDFLIGFLNEMWNELSAVPVKLADRIQNMWSFGTAYNLAAKMRIYFETKEYYLPLARHFDSRLYNQLQKAVDFFSNDPNLSLRYQGEDNFDEIRFRLWNYAAIRGREELTGYLDNNDRQTEKEIKSHKREVDKKISRIDWDEVDLPQIPPARFKQWIRSVEDTAVKLIAKRRLRSMLENYFEKGTASMAGPDFLEYGLQNNIPKVTYREAVAKLKEMGAKEIAVVEYGQSLPHVKYYDIALFETPKKLPFPVRQRLEQKVYSVTEELRPRSISVRQLKDGLQSRGIEFLGHEVYDSIKGETVPYIRIKSKGSIDSIVSGLKQTLKVNDPMLAYERVTPEGDEAIRFVFDVVNLDPKLSLQTDFRFNPYLVVDAIYEK